jgi:hypothetical protein
MHGFYFDTRVVALPVRDKIDFMAIEQQVRLA